MDYMKSTQAKNWLFTEESLDAHRRKVYEEAASKYGSLITYEQYRAYIQYYGDALLHYACKLNGWSRMQRYTALAYYNRCYVRKSIWDLPPPLTFLNCIYLVCKLAMPVGIDEFIDFLKLPEALLERFRPTDTIAYNELMALDAMKFNLKVHLPFHQLIGLVDGKLSVEDFNETSDFLMGMLETDALLLYPPGQLAFAALCHKVGYENACGFLETGLQPLPEEEIQHILSLEKVTYNPEECQQLEDSLGPEMAVCEALKNLKEKEEEMKSLLPPM